MWVPEWLGVPYCILRARFRGRGFSFEEARRELDMPASRLLKVLSELGKSGFLVSEIRDRKIRKYVLTDFDSFTSGVKAGKDFKDLDINEKLRRAFEDYGMKYLIVGGSAAFLYHAYQFPAKHDVEVFPKDYGFWRNLLPEAELFPRLNKESFEEGVEIDGLFVAPPERIVTEALEEGGITSTLDAASLIVSERGSKSINWKRLEKYAVKHKVVNELGVILEALDRELIKDYGKSPIPRKTIDELFTHVKNIGRFKEFPKTTLEGDKTYLDIGEKWRLKLSLPSYVIRKPVEDIAPFALGVV